MPKGNDVASTTAHGGAKWKSNVNVTEIENANANGRVYVYVYVYVQVMPSEGVSEHVLQ